MSQASVARRAFIGRFLRKARLLSREPLYSVMLKKASRVATHIIFIGSSSGKELFDAARVVHDRQISFACYEPRWQAIRRLSSLRRFGLIPRRVALHREAVVPENWVTAIVHHEFVDKGNLSYFKSRPMESASSCEEVNKNLVPITSLSRATAGIPDRASIFLAMDIEGLEVEILSEFCGTGTARFSEVFVAAELHFRLDGGHCDLLKHMAEQGFDSWLVETAAGAEKFVTEILSQPPIASGAGRHLYENISQKELLELGCFDSSSALVDDASPQKLIRSVLWRKTPSEPRASAMKHYSSLQS